MRKRTMMLLASKNICETHVIKKGTEAGRQQDKRDEAAGQQRTWVRQQQQQAVNTVSNAACQQDMHEFFEHFTPTMHNKEAQPGCAECRIWVSAAEIEISSPGKKCKKKKNNMR